MGDSWRLMLSLAIENGRTSWLISDVLEETQVDYGDCWETKRRRKDVSYCLELVMGNNRDQQTCCDVI